MLCFVCKGLFSDVNEVELAIVAVCVFAVTAIVLLLVFLCISWCVCRNRSNDMNKNDHELKKKWG